MVVTCNYHTPARFACALIMIVHEAFSKKCDICYFYVFCCYKSFVYIDLSIRKNMNNLGVNKLSVMKEFLNSPFSG
jgi:hypothetical protein